MSAQHTPGPWVLRDRVYITRASDDTVDQRTVDIPL